MPEMKAMEFTDKLNLQPVTRPVPQPKAGNPDSGLRHWRDSYREALIYDQSLCGWLDTIQGDARARILRHRCRISNPS